jgi:integrase
MLTAVHSGTAVRPSERTVGDYLQAWLDGNRELASKTKERYAELIGRQIVPFLGATPLQALRPAQVQQWHGKLLASGGWNGRPLSAQTVKHAHRILQRALRDAVTVELVARNVAHIVRPPKLEPKEATALKAEQVALMLDRLNGHPLFPLVNLALGTGARRGELLALRWTDVDFTANMIDITRSLEETKVGGLVFKTPKNKSSRRTIDVPASALEPLRALRKAQMEMRLACGAGKLPDGALVFCKPDGAPLSPDNISRDWRMAVKALKLPPCPFHGLRHTHVSLLLAAGLDIATVAKRCGHSGPHITLRVYAHLFSKSTDAAAVRAIDAALRGGR